MMFPYSSDEVLGILGDREPMALFVGPPDGSVGDKVVHLVLVLVVEGRDAYDHLVHQDSKGPPV